MNASPNRLFSIDEEQTLESESPTVKASNRSTSSVLVSEKQKYNNTMAGEGQPQINGMLGLEQGAESVMWENHQILGTEESIHQDSQDLQTLQEMLLSTIASVVDIEQRKVFCLFLASWVMDRTVDHQVSWESLARKFKHHLEKVQQMFDFNQAPNLLASIWQNTPVEIDMLVSRIDEARTVYLTAPRETRRGFAPKSAVGRSQGNAQSYVVPVLTTTAGQASSEASPLTDQSQETIERVAVNDNADERKPLPKIRETGSPKVGMTL